MCKSKNIDVRNHMSTISSEVITKLTEGAGERTEKKRPRQRRRRRRRGGRGSGSSTTASVKSDTTKTTNESADEEKAASKVTKKNTRSRRSSTRRGRKPRGGNAKSKETVNRTEEVKPKPRRTLYGGSRRPLTSEEVSAKRDSR